MASPSLILASASPRRRMLLERAGFTFTVEAAEVDEAPQPGETGEVLAARLAIAKALAVAERAPAHSIVLAADTIVICEGRLLGKPGDTSEASAMLELLSGRNHRVVTCWAIIPAAAPAARTYVGISVSIVRMREIPHTEIVRYVAGEEPYDKAGGYAIQGDGDRFVAAVLGPFDNVVGLPVVPVAHTLERLGISPGAAR